MFSSAFVFVLSGCVLGVLHVAAGIAIGLWIRRSPSTAGGGGHQEIVQAERIAQRLQALADDMSTCVGQHRSQLAEASRLLSAENVADEGTLADMVVGVIGDVVQANGGLQSKLELAELRLQEQAAEIEAHVCRAMTDALTGLPNRRALNDRLEASMAAWCLRGEVFSLFMLDVDHFKKLNDQYGHVAGDNVLAAVGAALRRALRSDDVVARYGGEEFVVLLADTPLDEAVQVARKIRQAVRRCTTMHDGVPLAITASGGVAMIETGEEATSLVERADAALYAAKSAGRNCIFMHDGSACRPLQEGTNDEAGDWRRSNEGGDELGQVTAVLGMVEALVQAGGGESISVDWFRESRPPREPVSVQLAEACNELRRYIAERASKSE